MSDHELFSDSDLSITAVVEATYNNYEDSDESSEEEVSSNNGIEPLAKLQKEISVLKLGNSLLQNCISFFEKRPVPVELARRREPQPLELPASIISAKKVGSSHLSNDAKAPCESLTTPMKQKAKLLQKAPRFDLSQIRQVYVRELESFFRLGYPDSIIFRNSKARDKNIYSPNIEYCEAEEDGDVIPESVAGLCKFCETVRFFALEDGSYNVHHRHVHAIDETNYLFPNPILVLNMEYWRFVCPVCYIDVSAGSWFKDPSPSQYIAHFDECHRLGNECCGHS